MLNVDARTLAFWENKLCVPTALKMSFTRKVKNYRLYVSESTTSPKLDVFIYTAKCWLGLNTNSFLRNMNFPSTIFLSNLCK